MLVSINRRFHPLLSYVNSPQWQPYLFLLRFAFWVIRVYKLKVLGVLMASLNRALHVVAKLLCFCLCLFDAIVELHAMDDKVFINLLTRK